MKKIFKRKSSSSPAQIESKVEPNLVTLINQVQQQMVSLEGKIDTLINQSSNQPSERPSRGRHFSKPFRSFDRSSGQDRGRRDDGFRERIFTQAICAECKKECEVPFKPSADRPVYCRECFAKRKGAGSFDQRKRPFFRRRK